MLCKSQVVFKRILDRLENLVEGLATYGAGKEQTEPGKE